MYDSSYTQLRRRCHKLEKDIAIQKKFDEAFYPKPPKQIKTKRWNFDSLNIENYQINQIARQAFDPSRSFISNYYFNSQSNNDNNPFQYDYEPSHILRSSQSSLSIFRPHRIVGQDQNSPQNILGYEKKAVSNRKQQMHKIPISAYEYNLIENPNSNELSPRSKTPNSDFDSTVEQFVDAIDDFKKW